MSGGFESIRNVSNVDGRREYFVAYGEGSHKVLVGVYEALKRIGGKVSIELDAEQDVYHIVSELPNGQLPYQTVDNDNAITASDLPSPQPLDQSPDISITAT